MKHINLKGEWIIKAPRDKVYEIVSDFEKMPERFPKVAESLKIVERNGNMLTIDGKAKSFGTVLPVKMKTQLIPPKGFISDNENAKLGTSGHEEFMMEEVPEGTKITYLYQLDIHKKWLRIIAKPFIQWFAMGVWKRAFIDRLRELV